MAPSKIQAASCSALVTLALALATAPGADACWRCRRPAPMSAYAPAPQASPQGYAPVGGVSAESTGSFLPWLNATRARHGLGPVGWDAGLASDAATNSSRGFGHSFMGRARRQNAGVGSLGAVEVAWLQSPAHASALLDPSIRLVGLANVGGVWTYSAY